MTAAARERSRLKMDLNENEADHEKIFARFHMEDEKVSFINNVEALEKEQKEAAISSHTALAKVLQSLLSSEKLRSYLLRCFVGLLMIAGFVYVNSLGPFAIIVLVQFVGATCFYEVMKIGKNNYRAGSWFMHLGWYFYVSLELQSPVLLFIIGTNRLIGFVAYICGFLYFIRLVNRSLKMEYYLLYGWIHCSLFMAVFPICYTESTLQGSIWFILPVALIFSNDIMAYQIGLLFGRTSLIALSPKKTWEGYLGAIPVVCPVTCDGKCKRPSIFRSFNNVSESKVFLPEWYSSNISPYPGSLHFLIISVIISAFGPFGGFFASGFKRAFNLKDFSSLFPGHGGMIDRMDCILLMSVVGRIYMSSFVYSQHPVTQQLSPSQLLQHVSEMEPHDQLELFQSLQNVVGLIK